MLDPISRHSEVLFSLMGTINIENSSWHYTGRDLQTYLLPILLSVYHTQGEPHTNVLLSRSMSRITLLHTRSGWDLRYSEQVLQWKLLPQKIPLKENFLSQPNRCMQVLEENDFCTNSYVTLDEKTEPWFKDWDKWFSWQHPEFSIPSWNGSFRTPPHSFCVSWFAGKAPMLTVAYESILFSFWARLTTSFMLLWPAFSKYLAFQCTKSAASSTDHSIITVLRLISSSSLKSNTISHCINSSGNMLIDYPHLWQACMLQYVVRLFLSYPSTTALS